MNSIRRNTIREFVEHNQVVTMGQLTELLPDVSLMTIHRDLNFLQEQGLLQKVRGGARSLPDSGFEPIFTARQVVNPSEKRVIAEKALSLLQGGTSVFLDAGTTMLTLAGLLGNDKINVVTTGPNIALELAKKKNIAVQLSGGQLNPNNLTLSGSAAMEMLEKINIDTAFMVASGYSHQGGFTCGKDTEAQIKSLVIQKARTVVMMMDSSKFEKLFPYTFAQLGQIHYLVTELAPVQLPAQVRQDAALEKVEIL